ncbi:MAG: hypothetical protein WCE21_00685 [Candidatus Babeliales bacterium]
MKCRVMVLLLTLSIGRYVRADQDTDSFNQNFDQTTTQIKGAFTGGINSVKGMGMGFGMVPDSYQYTYRVYNDTPVPITIGEEKQTSVMGARFGGNLNKSVALAPFTNSGEQFYKRKLFFSIWLSTQETNGKSNAFPTTIDQLKEMQKKTFNTADKGTQQKNKFYDRLLTSWGPDDSNVYYYRVFSRRGALVGESLDVKGEGTAFLGQFINNSNKEVQLAFTYDATPYTVTLEQKTFSMLQTKADAPNAIRPPVGTDRGFTITDGTTPLAYIPIAPFGICNVSNTGTEKNPKWTLESSLLYSYELYNDGSALRVDAQGLGIGNFSQPINGLIRDITPVACSLWVKSTAQLKEQIKKAQKDKQSPESSAELLFDEPYTIWISYQTKDFQLLKQMNVGQLFNFSLIRPCVNEKQAWLYIVALSTNDAAKAKKFMTKLHTGSLGKQAFFTAIKDPYNTTDIQNNLKPNSNGLLIEQDTKIRGVVLLADCFFPQGTGSGTYYYELNPSVLRVDQFAQGIFFDKKYYSGADDKVQLSDSVLRELGENLKRWIFDYRKNAATTIADIKQYVIAHIDTNFITNGALNSYGEQFFQQLIKGPVSIEHYPVIRKAGLNYFVFSLGAKPDGWPSNK